MRSNHIIAWNGTLMKYGHVLQKMFDEKWYKRKDIQDCEQCTRLYSDWMTELHVRHCNEYTKPVLFWFVSFQAVLGAIIWVAIYAILKQVKDLWMYMKLSLSDTVRIAVVYM